MGCNLKDIIIEEKTPCLGDLRPGHKVYINFASKELCFLDAESNIISLGKINCSKEAYTVVFEEDFSEVEVTPTGVGIFLLDRFGKKTSLLYGDGSHFILKVLSN